MFRIHLKQSGTDRAEHFDFVADDTSIGRKWEMALIDRVVVGDYISEPERIYNLNDKWTDDHIVDRLNICIDKINAYWPGFIPFKITLPLDQPQLNLAHKYFEMMVGRTNFAKVFYEGADPETRLYIQEFNVQIHRKENIGGGGRIVVSYKERFPFPLALEDFQYFSPQYQPGDVVLKYCHKGKKLIDVWKDRDDVVGEHNIIAQTHYSSDFKVLFGHGYKPDGPAMQDFERWFKENEGFLGSLGYVWGDPRNAIGHCKVGRIIGNPQAITQQIYGCDQLSHVEWIDQ